MTTLATLKAQIVSDLDGRTDLTSDIAVAISRAIEHYQRDRFYWNERRSLTFSTFAAQDNYGTAASADIANMVRIDFAHITINNYRYPLRRRDFYELEQLYDDAALNGQPSEYAYFNREVWLYPRADNTYTIRLLGHMIIAEPASDGEADNPWMTEAFELIRCRAKAYLAVHKLRDNELAQIMGVAEQEALARLRKETALRLGSGKIEGAIC